jgi:hypothetical protein
MADTLIERLTGQATTTGMPVEVHLVVSDQTLLAGGDEPAWLHGYGPVGPDHARDLTRDALAAGLASLRRLYSAPASGALVAMDSRAREFPTALGLFLELRDQTCRTAYCDAPIRHHDHITAHADGGATSAANGQGACEACNYAKQAPGWRVRPLTGPPESGDRHTIEITTPTGHVLRSTAPAAPTPLRWHPPPSLRRPPSVAYYYPDIELAVDKDLLRAA